MCVRASVRVITGSVVLQSKLCVCAMLVRMKLCVNVGSFASLWLLCLVKCNCLFVCECPVKCECSVMRLCLSVIVLLRLSVLLSLSVYVRMLDCVFG